MTTHSNRSVPLNPGEPEEKEIVTGLRTLQAADSRHEKADRGMAVRPAVAPFTEGSKLPQRWD